MLPATLEDVFSCRVSVSRFQALNRFIFTSAWAITLSIILVRFSEIEKRSNLFFSQHRLPPPI